MESKIFTNYTKNNLSKFIDNREILDNKNSLLVSLYNKKNIIINFINNIIINIKINNNYQFEYKKYCNSRFVDKKIINLQFIYSLLIEWNNNNKIIIKTNVKNIKSIILKIKILIYLIEYIKSISINSDKSVFIILILSNLKKIYPIKKKIITSKNVNSGYTDFTNNVIFIWRYEEFEKVLFHEIIHFCKLDKSTHYISNIINTDNNSHNYFEAITDLYAILYHIIYISIITKIELKILLELEISYIKNQAMKLNNFFNLQNWKNKPNKYINQNTSAFSYYILKYLLFEYLLTLQDCDIYKYLNDINYNDLLNKILNKPFNQKEFINLDSMKMTLLQLK